MDVSTMPTKQCRSQIYPRLDVNFDNFYANGQICCPSRASVWTGRHLQFMFVTQRGGGKGNGTKFRAILNIWHCQLHKTSKCGPSLPGHGQNVSTKEVGLYGEKCGDKVAMVHTQPQENCINSEPKTVSCPSHPGIQLAENSNV